MLPQYRILDVELDATRGIVRRADSEVTLRQQALEVLLFLIRHKDRAVTKEELFETIWGDTAVTDDAVVQCVVEIRKALGDEVRAPRFIRTVPKVGYRFLAPVQAVELANDPVPAPEPVPAIADPIAVPSTTARRELPTGPFFRRWMTATFAVITATMLLGSLVYLLQQRAAGAGASDPRLVETPGLKRVAIASFDDHTNDPALAWLRRGLADMVVTNLSQLDNFAVLGRQHVELLLERSGVVVGEETRLDQALAAARRGNAEVLVLGSVAALGTTLRIEARVHDATNGRLLASFSVVANTPDEIIRQTDVLSGQIVTALHGRRRSQANVVDVMTNSLEAYRCYVLGLEKAQGLETKEAIYWLRRAVEADPQFAAAYARIGYVYAMIEAENGSARPYLEKAFELSGRLTDHDRASIAAWYSVAHLDFAAAIDAYRRLLERYPDDVEAHWRLGVLLAGEERFPEATAILERGLSLNPDFPPLINALGGTFLSMHQYGRARQMYERYVAAAPDRPNAYDSLGSAYYAAGDYDRAITEFQRALQLNPTFGIAIIHLGNTYFRLGQYGEALRYFDRYIEVARSAPERSRGFGSKAWVEHRRGNREAAWRAVLASEKANDVASGGIVIAFAQKRSIAEAWYQEAISQPWAGRGTRLSLRIRLWVDGEVAFHRGRIDEALKSFSQVVKSGAIFFNIDDFEDSLADAFLRLKRFDDAIREYERVLSLNANRPITRFNYAQALDGAEQRDRARAEYETFLTQWRTADRDLPELATARERIAALVER